MKKSLNDILSGIETIKEYGKTKVQINGLQFDSRSVSAGDVFVAVKGTQVDGHFYIDQAIQKGATVIVCEILPNQITSEITYLQVEDSASVLAKMASNYFNNPSYKLKLIGITGTNGKTTIATLLYELFQKLGYKVGLLSTIRNRIGEEEVGATHTTPDPIQLNKLLYKMVEAGCSHVFMEVSSHAIHQNRIAGLSFVGGVFTNITHDHLDYHKTFADYLKVKKQFFDDLSDMAFALSNLDDRNGNFVLQNTKALKKTYGLKGLADFKAKIIENSFEGLALNINGNEVWCSLVGEFNASNLIAVYAVADLLGEEPTEILTALSSVKPVEGRFDMIKSANNIVCIVDYAHTPDAVKKLLETVNAIRTRNENLIALIGAGGDRDNSKRKDMGLIAGRLSDRLIITSDNPRTEDPEKIIEDIKAGVDPIDYKKVISIANRKEAIKTACMLAQTGDIIVVAGKGHESYQEICGVKHPFNDKEILKEALLFNTNSN